MIQAPGLSGTPSRGQRSSATRERVLDRVLGEVEVAEGADQRRDRPPRLTPEQAVDDLVGVAATRPALRLRCAVRRPLVVHHRADLDGADWASGSLRPTERRVEVGDVDQVEAAELLLGLGVRPVGDDVLAVAEANGRRGLATGARPSPATSAPDSRSSEVNAPYSSEHLLPGLGRRILRGRLVAVDGEQVLHDVPPVIPDGAVRRSQPNDERATAIWTAWRAALPRAGRCGSRSAATPSAPAP